VGGDSNRQQKRWAEIHARVVEKIRRYLRWCRRRGFGWHSRSRRSRHRGDSSILNICEQIGSPDLGLNLDTGHAWACRELVPLLPFELQARIFGTHLGDNRSTENVKMPLGQGTVPWSPLLRNLRAAGYRGSLDIEVVCPADEVGTTVRGESTVPPIVDCAPQGESA